MGTYQLKSNLRQLQFLAGSHYTLAESRRTKLTGIVINLCCPAQCVQHRHFISPDFWGEVRVLLRNYFGQDLFILCQCSAAGDQCPVDLVRWVEPESDLNDPNLSRSGVPKRKADPSMFDLAGMRRTGKRIAREIIDIYEEGLDAPQTDVKFSHLVQHYSLPLRRVTLADAEKARQSIHIYLQEKEGDLDFNDAAKAEKGGHYSAFVSSGTVGHEGGEMLVRQTLTDIARLFQD